MDAVQKANSGHPGAPLGMADIAEVLWNDFMKHNPGDPTWPDRDRFVFSNGHGSMLIYAILHLTGYDLSIEDIKNFRQFGSKTPGHPEYGVTPGIETTTGPLGQGLANAVGMAMAEKALAAEFNRENYELFDHYTYVLAGDGCLMEGVSHEACSLAGTLKLSKLVLIYDDNGISIDGKVSGWFTEDVPACFEAYGWHAVRDVDGHDPEAVRKALEEAKSVNDRPSIVCCKTVIGFGCPKKAGSEKCHGAPLGDEEIAATREKLGWEYGQFEIPDEIYRAYDANEKGAEAQAAWRRMFDAYAAEYPKEAAELTRRLKGETPDDFESMADELVRKLSVGGEDVATRKASGKVLEELCPLLPEMVGGSADLSGSNNTMWSGSKAFTAEDFKANYVHYGVREFAMQGIMNGMALHGGFLPYGGTFLVFADYMRSALRMASLIGARTVSVLTHDSIGVGEDGPTHQPIEHAASLRIIPGLRVWRPCDAVETAAAWKASIMYKGPSCLLLSRQTTRFQLRSDEALAGIERGGYVLKDCDGEPEAVIIATGSEVGLAVDAAGLLERSGRRVRVVSMPCMQVFDHQDKAYRDAVLPPQVTARVAVEAAASVSWHKYVGFEGRIVGVDRFGESAPAPVLFEHFGFTARNVAGVVEEVLDGGH
jgi:transketolase